jgi:predicted kinase
LALLVDIDGLRMQLGQWERQEESRVLARTLALALPEAHLSSGHDVVIPQYVGRIEFVERLADVAHRCGAEFLEVVLVTEPNVATARFRARRAEYEVAGKAHPEADVPDTNVDAFVHESLDRLETSATAGRQRDVCRPTATSKRRTQLCSR